MSRALLHKSKLDEFKGWLNVAGITHRPGRGEFQVLQVALPRNQWGVVYDRLDAREHFTVTESLEPLVVRFIRAQRRTEQDAEQEQEQQPDLPDSDGGETD